MRTIKFRVWDKENKELFGFQNRRGAMFIREDGVLERQEAGMGGSDWNGDQCYCSTNRPLTGWKFEDRYIIQQFTGFKDKNGKELYEGDIVYWNACCNFKIVWDEARGGWDLEQVDFRELYYNDVNEDGWPPSKDLTYEGNIFEKPELISK